jgi:hypothetical protein
VRQRIHSVLLPFTWSGVRTSPCPPPHLTRTCLQDLTVFCNLGAPTLQLDMGLGLRLPHAMALAQGRKWGHVLQILRQGEEAVNRVCTPSEGGILYGGWTLLHFACDSWDAGTEDMDVEVVEALLGLGADPRACGADDGSSYSPWRGTRRCTPLHLAAARRSSRLCARLIAAGAYVNATNSLHLTPLMAAVDTSGSTPDCLADVVSVFLTAGIGCPGPGPGRSLPWGVEGPLGLHCRPHGAHTGPRRTRGADGGRGGCDHHTPPPP